MDNSKEPNSVQDYQEKKEKRMVVTAFIRIPSYKKF